MKVSKLKGSSKSTGLCRLRVEGEITIYKAAEVMEKLVPYWRDYKEFELDLSGISDIDTAGVQLLLMFDRKSGASGKKARLAGESEPVSEALGIYRLAGRFEAQMLSGE